MRWEEFDAVSREEIVRHYAPKIKILALRLKAKLPQSVELAELLSAGSLGLIEALGKFDPSLGIKFETYAESRIKGAMLDELRRMDIFSRGFRQRIRQLESSMRKIEATTGETPSYARLADETGMTAREVEAALEMMQSQLCLNLDAIQENLASSRLGAPEDDPYQSAALQEIIDKVAGLIGSLTPREQLVLSLYYAEELNMREAAEVMEITEGRVSQLHSQALGKLKKMFHSRYGVQES